MYAEIVPNAWTLFLQYVLCLLSEKGLVPPLPIKLAAWCSVTVAIRLLHFGLSVSVGLGFRDSQLLQKWDVISQITCVLLKIFLKDLKKLSAMHPKYSLFHLFYIKWRCLYVGIFVKFESLILLFCSTLLFLPFLRIENEWKRLSNFASYILSRVCRLHWRLYACQAWNFIRMSIFLNKYQGRHKYWPTLNWEWAP